MPGSRPAYATKQGRFTPFEIAMVYKLADAGLTTAQIAMRLQRHPSGVMYHVLRAGVRQKPLPQGLGDYVRNGRTVRRFTPEQDAFIEQLDMQAVPRVEICRRYEAQFGHKRAPNSIKLRLMQLAAQEALADGD